ncbi:MAG: hypothetical protein ACRCXB_13800 [Aeromonadaceae bacterium]
MDKMREEFEAWAKKDELAINRYDDGYLFDDTNDCWRAWKASRAALCVELPEGDGGSQDTNLIAVEVALDNAGVPYK